LPQVERHGRKRDKKIGMGEISVKRETSGAWRATFSATKRGGKKEEGGDVQRGTRGGKIT